MSGDAISWGEFEAAAPEIARAGPRLLEDRPGVAGAAFLAGVLALGAPPAVRTAAMPSYYWTTRSPRSTPTGASRVS